MTFARNENLDPSVAPELEEPPQIPSTSTGLQKNGKALLQPFTPVVFVEAESTLAMDLDAGKYKPINVPTASDSESPPVSETRLPKPQSPAKQPSASTSTSTAPAVPLDTFKLTQKWSGPEKDFGGLENLGNSCFMNSTLQILIHTVPLLNVLYTHHSRADCAIAADDDAFCFACKLRTLAFDMLSSKGSRPRVPNEFFNNLRKIAPSFRRGRQEDAHEFLRFSIDALQLSAQRGVKDVPEKVADTSWVYRLFGGKFRSRVCCSECGHNSDTQETLLDLSIDVGRCDTLAEALKKFSTIEKLEGKNKYKCEKCKKPVNASKQITVHKAPQALCIHLKRFTPWGRKLTHQVEYPSKLSIQDVMSKGQNSPTYRLYGIILHAGGTPNSGHYYAYAQNTSGRWTKINDDEISEARNGPPYDHKNAYMLFYMREPSSLDDIVAQAVAPAPSNSYKASGYTFHPPPKIPGRLPPKINPKVKRRVVQSEDEEDTGKPVTPTSPIITKASLKSPRIDDDVTSPSPCKRPRIEDDDLNKENRPSNTKPMLDYASVTRVAQGPMINSKLDPKNVSSGPAEPDKSQITIDAQVPIESQLTVESHIAQNEDMEVQKSPSLPTSHEFTPEPAPHKRQTWQMDDDPHPIPTIAHANSPPPSSFVDSSSTSTKQDCGGDEKEEGSNGAAPVRPRSAWASSEPRNWASGGTSGVIRPKKTYQSNSKKEQRKGNGSNPYGLMGLSDSATSRPQNGGGTHNGATIGNRKHRKPGAI